jgi:hypothetical protein
LYRGVEAGSESNPGDRVEAAGEAPHAVFVGPGAESCVAALPLKAGHAVIGLDGFDLQTETSPELGDRRNRRNIDQVGHTIKQLCALPVVVE